MYVERGEGLYSSHRTVVYDRGAEGEGGGEKGRIE